MARILSREYRGQQIEFVCGRGLESYVRIPGFTESLQTDALIVVADVLTICGEGRQPERDWDREIVERHEAGDQADIQRLVGFATECLQAVTPEPPGQAVMTVPADSDADAGLTPLTTDYSVAPVGSAEWHQIYGGRRHEFGE